jgi:hypothetical protein
MKKLGNWLGLLTSLLIVYAALYFVYRMTHLETVGDEGDTDTYVIYGSNAAYQVFQPAAHVDTALTGVRPHLGPVIPPRAP